MYTTHRLKSACTIPTDQAIVSFGVIQIGADTQPTYASLGSDKACTIDLSAASIVQANLDWHHSRNRPARLTQHRKSNLDNPTRSNLDRSLRFDGGNLFRQEYQPPTVVCVELKRNRNAVAVLLERKLLSA